MIALDAYVSLLLSPYDGVKVVVSGRLIYVGLAAEF